MDKTAHRPNHIAKLLKTNVRACSSAVRAGDSQTVGPRFKSWRVQQQIKGNSDKVGFTDRGKAPPLSFRAQRGIYLFWIKPKEIPRCARNDRQEVLGKPVYSKWSRNIGYAFAALSVASTRESLNGTLRTRTPVASKIALATAAITGLQDASPAP